MPGISREISTSGLHRSNQRVAAKWAACVHTVFGSVRFSRPSPIVAISSSDVNGVKLRMVSPSEWFLTGNKKDRRSRRSLRSWFWLAKAKFSSAHSHPQKRAPAREDQLALLLRCLCAAYCHMLIVNIWLAGSKSDIDSRELRAAFRFKRTCGNSCCFDGATWEALSDAVVLKGRNFRRASSGKMSMRLGVTATQG